VRLRGRNAATNCALSDYAKEMEEHMEAQVTVHFGHRVYCCPWE